MVQGHLSLISNKFTHYDTFVNFAQGFFIGCTKQMKLKKLFRGYMTPVFSKKYL
jgi:uncharacterized protein YebE (UPF0316 family)